jgi:hypothetical protein
MIRILPVVEATSTLLSVPRAFRNLTFPAEAVELELNCALLPGKVTEGIEIPVGSVWLRPSSTQVPLPGGFSYWTM